MDKIIPLFDMTEIRKQAKEEILTDMNYIGQHRTIISHAITRKMNEIMITDLYMREELPKLYYQGVVNIDGERTRSMPVQAPILGVKPNSRLFILEGNPFNPEEEEQNILRTLINTSALKWLPEIQALNKAHKPYMTTYLLAGSEYECPEVVGYLAKDISNNSFGKLSLDRWED